MKRRRPLVSRRQPMRRTGSTRSSRRSKYRARIRATDYMLGVKQLPCAAAIVPGHVCSGPIEADHAGSRGIGRKAADSTVIPMCQLAHRQRTDFSGPFRGWDQARMREFLTGRIVQTQRAMLDRGFALPIAELAPPDMAGAPALASGAIALYHDGRVLSADIRNATPAEIAAIANRLAEDLREDGNVDVRKPDAVARVASEGAKQP